MVNIVYTSIWLFTLKDFMTNFPLDSNKFWWCFYRSVFIFAFASLTKASDKITMMCLLLVVSYISPFVLKVFLTGF